jgi:N-acetylglutamate synthase-like GNAT family acetyltransferase
VNVPNSYQIREYRPGDDDSIYTLVLSILTTEFKDVPPEHYLADLRDIQSVYAGERNEFFVCEVDSQIVGTIAIKEDDQQTALIRRLFVNPHYRGKSVGRKLLEKVVAFCKEKKYSQIAFTGNNHMHNVKVVLQKLGFKEEEDVNLPGLEIFRLVAHL